MSEEDGQTHRTYSPEFKQEAVQRSLDPSKTFTQVAQELNISPRLLRRWRNEPRSSQEANGVQSIESVHPDDFERDALQAANRHTVGIRSRPTATRALVPARPVQVKKTPIKVAANKSVEESATEVLRTQLDQLRTENNQLRQERDALKTTLRLILTSND